MKEVYVLVLRFFTFFQLCPCVSLSDLEVGWLVFNGTFGTKRLYRAM